MTLLIVLWAFAMASGAGWTWGFERHKATYNELLPDRRTRLAFPSVIWLGIFLWPIHAVYTEYFSTFASENPRNPPILVWVACSVAPVVPWVAGYCYGWFRKQSWAQWWPGKPRGAHPTGFDYMMDHVTRESKPDPSPIAMIGFMDNNTELRIVVGQIWYASAAPHKQDIYLEPVFFLGSYDEWKSHSSVSHSLSLLGVGCLIQHKNVVWIQIDPGVRELIAIRQQIEEERQLHEPAKTS